jgi:enediyne polyketide synthase
VLHAAGTNTPQLLPAIDRQKFLSTLAPKVAGLRNIVAAIDPEALRLLVTFGSLIARTGLRGEADYALANEWLATEVERWQASHTSCRCLNIEWSVWSGIGMGQRLGRMDLLKRQGITPITPDEGVRWLQRLLSNDISATSVVVTGRFGNPPTLKLAPSDIP